MSGDSGRSDRANRRSSIRRYRACRRRRSSNRCRTNRHVSRPSWPRSTNEHRSQPLPANRRTNGRAGRLRVRNQSAGIGALRKNRVIAPPRTHKPGEIVMNSQNTRLFAALVATTALLGSSSASAATTWQTEQRMIHATRLPRYSVPTSDSPLTFSTRSSCLAFGSSYWCYRCLPGTGRNESSRREPWPISQGKCVRCLRILVS